MSDDGRENLILVDIAGSPPDHERAALAEVLELAGKSLAYFRVVRGSFEWLRQPKMWLLRVDPKPNSGPIPLPSNKNEIADGWSFIVALLRTKGFEIVERPPS